jgi:hypothetical protein
VLQAILPAGKLKGLASRSETGDGNKEANNQLKTNHMAKILYDDEIGRKLVEEFKGTCVARTMRNALNGSSNSDICKCIRKRALDLGARQKGTETIKYL